MLTMLDYIFADRGPKMMKPKTSRHLVAAAACASMMAAGITAYSPSAQACGGLFCNNQQPVNQAAERIIFSDNADDTVTALVQIMYQGPSEKFAWVLPVPGEPDVSVSSTAAFDRLQTATNPSYRMNTTVEGTCDTRGGGFFGSDDATAEAGGMNNANRNPEDDGVTVVNSGHVGPYDYTTISVDPGNENPTQVALDWLEQNNYDVSALGEQTITPYLEDGMNLLAFRLSKNADTGDIRPVRITYDAELPMIPIKLTAVAANDDMGVMVWVLSDERAIPSNYKSLRLNEAAIDWFNPNNNYNDIINRAADEAGGQGFVTELAWPTDRTLPPPNQFSNGQDLADVIFSENEERFWEDRIKNTDWTGNEFGLLQQSSRYAAFDGYLEVLEATVPVPSRLTTEEFAQCPSCYQSEMGGEDGEIDNFDPQTFITQLELNVIKPMIETQELVTSRPYITRLYTTMSAGDMTLDPVFDFNDSLGDHSNAHVAERIIECGDEDYTRNEAPWRVELPQGDIVFGSGSTWPVSSEDMPATRAIVQDRNSGDGEVVVDNAPEIDSFIERHNQRVTDEFSGGGCQTAHPASVSLARNMSLALMFGAFGLLLIRVRRREE
ncbi:DUF2330 domain-containing protein [Persicimonas caeni]|uniref:DUF2330 domain-containing protein n=1 Tax=Persicimonas caeni TaxID=2292766 RepID=A0A4Y6PPZ0_PERCE|nr:DUF2330 domain-containing protein [Persicimonas caeni]QDG50396.1 DUF2330 domain-containing protein [Persicimonas caeni]QED31617.1 DUF2330 domain-containing protein [Persicimonas caeni]